MRVALIGACDRNNYGDLLMPVVFKKQFINKNGDIIDFCTYAQIENSIISQLKCDSTKSLYSIKNTSDVCIFVGGEILSASYKLMYFNIIKNRITLFALRAINKFFPNLIEKYCKKKLNGMEKTPWAVNKKNINCRKVVYNTVGGYSDSVIDYLIDSDYVSIRNKKDYEKYKKKGVDVKLVPDSMITISKYFTDEDYDNNVSELVKDKCKDEYFVFQINNRDLSNNVRLISDQIRKICETFKMKCILLPIGIAQLHDDYIALKRIYKECYNDKVIIVNDLNIYETTYVLKNAYMYIGTSLHGMVISTSYLVPHFLIINSIPKMNDYMETWNTSSIMNNNPAEMYNNFEKIFNNYSYEKSILAKKQAELIDLAENNFDIINGIIKEVSDEKQS